MIEVLETHKQTLDLGIAYTQKQIDEHLFIYGPKESENEIQKKALENAELYRIILLISRSLYDTKTIQDETDVTKLKSTLNALKTTYETIANDFETNKRQDISKSGNAGFVSRIHAKECDYAAKLVEKFESKEV